LISLLTLFAENLFPILAIAAAGFGIQRSLNINPRPISQIVFYIFTPALVFNLLLTTEILPSQMVRMVGFAIFIMAVIGLISWGIGKVIRLDSKTASAVVLTSTFANTGNFGLSLTNFAFGEIGLAWAVIYYITSALMINSAGVFIASAGSSKTRDAVFGLLKVPALYAVPIAFLLRSFHVDLPLMISRPIELLASATIPTMLIVLGMQIGQSGLPKKLKLISIPTVLRLIVSPLIAITSAAIFGLEGASYQAGILEAATPVAVLTSIIAIEYDVDPDFVAGSILISTLLSPLTITPLISMLN
jgi:predicted permease